MANLCDTQYKITGEKKAVADLWNTLQEMNVNEKNIWLGDFGEPLRHRLQGKRLFRSW